MNLTVRQGTFADLDAVAVLFDRYRVYQGRDPDLTAARSFLRDRFDHGQSVVFLALRDDLPAGFAQLYPSFSSVALARVFVLNDLFVCETCRRIGVASSLLEAVERYAWSLGASRVTLNVDKTNASGLALYEASGWKRDEQFHMYHRLP